MFPLGHMGIALGLAVALERTLGPRARFDPRILLVGALLPDLLDKPLQAVGFGPGRAIGHTLVFAIVLVAVVALLVRAGRSPVLVALPFGVGVHFALDLMWDSPEILLWPAYGIGFETGGKDLEALVATLLTDAYVLGGEIVGAVVLVAFAAKRGLFSFAALRAFLHGAPSGGASRP